MRFQKILTDVDGVLLDWETAFHAWMAEKGYDRTGDSEISYHMDQLYGIDKERAKELILRFNESAWIGYLKPLRDSVEVLHDMMIQEGFHFEAITSLSLDHWAGELRRKNLERWFGASVRRCICLDCGGHKDEILKEYDPTWWIEDKWENAIAGLNAGHRVILMNHGHNQDRTDDRIYRADNWKEIYSIIKENPL